MTWTYTGNPGSSDKDYVRYKIGDTDEANQLISDEEIDYELAQTNDMLKAAYQCARAVLKKLARRPDKKIGPSSIQNSQLKDLYKSILEDIKSEMEDAGMALPSTEELHEAIFDIGMMDNEGDDY